MKKQNKLIVGNRSWADTIPEWVLDEVKAERTINAAINLTGRTKLTEQEQVGDAELVAYLYPATMAHPMDRDYSDIYLYLTTKLMLRTKRVTRENLPDIFREIFQKGLTDYQESLLRELRQKIFKARGGEISHPVFDALKEVFKEAKEKVKKDKKLKNSRAA